MAADIVLCHEERYDVSGYPAGLKGEEIPLPSRLSAVIDTLEAMTFDAAKTNIIRMAGIQFDPEAVEAFLKGEDKLREITLLDVPRGYAEPNR